jgi:hypothetical protein
MLRAHGLRASPQSFPNVDVRAFLRHARAVVIDKHARLRSSSTSLADDLRQLDEIEAVLLARAASLTAPGNAAAQQDLVLAALVIALVCFSWVNFATQPFPNSLIEPLLLAIGYLSYQYNEMNER